MNKGNSSGNGSDNDDLWIDFIEDELDPSLREDMQRLLARSSKEKEVCTRYETLRGALEDTNDVREEKKFVESFDFDALHAKIMAQIPETTSDRRAPARASTANRTLRRISSRARNVVIPSFMVGLLVMSFALHHMLKPSMLEARETDFSEHLVASAHLTQVVEGRSMLGEDLATSAASAKLERMSARDARALASRLTL